MKRILVSLVSDQTIQNVLFAKEINSIDKHIIITTESMEKAGKSNWIIKALNLNESGYEKIEVIEDSLIDIKKKIEKLNAENTIYYVNLTGGTKLMSIGLFDYFSKKNSEIFYVSGGKNIYRKIFPTNNKPENLLTYRTNLLEYLTSYGINVSTNNFNKKNNLLKNEKQTIRIFKNQISNSLDYEVVNLLRTLRGKVKKIHISDYEGLDVFLESLGFESSDKSYLDKYEIDYLTGGWFEELIYLYCKRLYSLENGKIGINIILQNNGVQNEFDIMFVHENQLHVIECKTSIFDSISNRNLTNDSLYKLAALRKEFGLFAKSSFFTLSKDGDKKNNIKTSYFDRAKILGTELIDYNKLISFPYFQKLIK